MMIKRTSGPRGIRYRKRLAAPDETKNEDGDLHTIGRLFLVLFCSFFGQFDELK